MGKSPSLIEIKLLGAPLRLREQSLAHAEELVRELTLVQLSAHSTEASFPADLLNLSAQMKNDYLPFHSSSGTELVVEDAGDDHVDVTYRVPDPIARQVMPHLYGALLKADEYCRESSYLLTLPAGAEVVAYRTWVRQQFDRQVRGDEATPWQQWYAEHGQQGPVLEPVDFEPIAGASVVLEPWSASVGASRRHVRLRLESMGRSDLADNAELCVSELVTNAMIHARTDFSVTVRPTREGRVRIEVRDCSAAPARLRPGQIDNCTGRGIRLVHSLSHEWGITSLPASEGPGKVVWFEPAAEVRDGFSQDEWADQIADLL